MNNHLSEDELVLHYYGETDRADEARVESHLASCAECQFANQQLRQVMTLVDSAAPVEAPPGFERTAWARLEPALDAEARRGWRTFFWFPQWALAGAALWFIANSVTSVAAARLPLFVAVAGLGYTISYLMLFAPGGLGPREAIFHAALSQVVAPGFSAVSVVMMRLVQTLTELLAAVVGVLFLRKVERAAGASGD